MKSTIKLAYNHLSNDKVMSYLIDKFGDKINWGNRYNSNYALSIANLIIEQQISFKAAITVKKRFEKIVNKKSESEIMNMSNSDLQSIGISFRKAEYIKNVFYFFKSKTIDFDKMSNKEIIDCLVSIKGVGEWTAQMFLIFNLFRQDIFSPKDLALINSIKKNYFLKSVGKSEIEKLTKNWSPYNSIACLLLWESVENQIFFKDYK
jgi:DNA-3-methyladenine glycosylase II